MTNRSLVLLSALTSAIVFAVLFGVSQLWMYRSVQAQPGIVGTPRQITVVGEGEGSGTPDTAVVQMGVETEAATTKEALSENNAQVAAILSRLKELGVNEKDIQTSNFSISATYDDEGRRITGYQVSNMVSVTIRSLEQAGTLLDEVVQLGANRIYGITFEVDDPSALLDAAREQAMANARAKAEQLAKAGGANLGMVLVITENVGSATPMPMMVGRELSMDKAVPLEVGEQHITVQIQATFELQ